MTKSAEPQDLRLRVIIAGILSFILWFAAWIISGI